MGLESSMDLQSGLISDDSNFTAFTCPILIFTAFATFAGARRSVGLLPAAQPCHQHL